MRARYNKTIIFALNTGSVRTDIEALNQFGIFRFQQMVGCYKGSTEDSYLITMPEGIALIEFLRFLMSHNQESILIQREEGDCELYYLYSKEQVMIGSLKVVDRDKAMESDAWTLDLNSGRYFVAS